MSADTDGQEVRPVCAEDLIHVCASTVAAVCKARGWVVPARSKADKQEEQSTEDLTRTCAAALVGILSSEAADSETTDDKREFCAKDGGYEVYTLNAAILLLAEQGYIENEDLGHFVTWLT